MHLKLSKSSFCVLFLAVSRLSVETHGFSLIPSRTSMAKEKTSGQPREKESFHPTFSHNQWRSMRSSGLFGLLDDMMAGDTSSTEKESPANEEFENLFHSLVFASGDIKVVIEKKIDECSAPEFLQYLQSLSESSEDAEEAQALTDLLDSIASVQTSMEEARKQAEAEAAAKKELQASNNDAEEESSTNSSNETLSAADVLKRANEIDRAAFSAAASDDEKPSDFISDCKEVAGLSSSFNQRGQMRVGGR